MASSPLACPGLEEVIKRSIMALCEVNIKYDHQLDVLGCVMVRSDNIPTLTFMLQEHVDKHAPYSTSLVKRDAPYSSSLVKRDAKSLEKSRSYRHQSSEAAARSSVHKRRCSPDVTEMDEELVESDATGEINNDTSEQCSNDNSSLSELDPSALSLDNFGNRALDAPNELLRKNIGITKTPIYSRSRKNSTPKPLSPKALARHGQGTHQEYTKELDLNSKPPSLIQQEVVHMYDSFSSLDPGRSVGSVVKRGGGTHHGLDIGTLIQNLKKAHGNLGTEHDTSKCVSDESDLASESKHRESGDSGVEMSDRCEVSDSGVELDSKEERQTKDSVPCESGLLDMRNQPDTVNCDEKPQLGISDGLQQTFPLFTIKSEPKDIAASDSIPQLYGELLNIPDSISATQDLEPGQIAYSQGQMMAFPNLTLNSFTLGPQLLQSQAVATPLSEPFPLWESKPSPAQPSISKPWLRARRRGNHDGKHFECPTCGMLLANKNNLRNHINSAHTHSRLYICHLCQRVHYSAQALSMHRRRHHRNVPKRHVCNTCGKSYKIKSDLSAHSCKIHMREDSDCEGGPDVNRGPVDKTTSADTLSEPLRPELLTSGIMTRSKVLSAGMTSDPSKPVSMIICDESADVVAVDAVPQLNSSVDEHTSSAANYTSSENAKYTGSKCSSAKISTDTTSVPASIPGLPTPSSSNPSRPADSEANVFTGTEGQTSTSTSSGSAVLNIPNLNFIYCPKLEVVPNTILACSSTKSIP